MNEKNNNLPALALIGLGAFFLITQVTGMNIFGTLWPFFVILPGTIFLYYAFNGDKNAAGLAIPGALISGTGVILLYQNMTGHWASWAYVWTLYAVFLGWGLMFMGRRTNAQTEYKVGREFVKYGLISFVGLWLIFEMFFFNGMGGLARYIIPAGLILVGVYLLSGRQNIFQLPVLDLSNGHHKAKNGYTNGHHDPLRKKIDDALDEIEHGEK